MREPVQGWGRSGRSVSEVAALDADFVPATVRGANGRGVLGRGLGRSYGDASLNSGGRLVVLQGGLELDQATGRLRVAAGTTFEQILSACLPAGWSLPVLPGTRFVTVGGAIAADVHGKNHWHAGTLGRWLDEIVLVDGEGSRHLLTPQDKAFWATVGGMGLTGVIVAATLRLVPVVSSWLDVHDRHVDSLDGVLTELDVAARTSAWAVAWVDGLARGAALGRGIVSRAEVLPAERVPTGAPLAYAPTAGLRAPSLPRSGVTPLTARVFNAAWWRRPRPGGPTTLTSFFHPLDGLTAWNRLYGPRGFLQYQFVVPLGAEQVVQSTLEQIGSHGGAPFLGVLKRFGEAGPGMLSFPRPGWSLAVDLPHTPGLATVLDGLDELVACAGGAIYLAKDARLRPELLAVMYPRLDEWREVQAQLDPSGRMQSDLDRRLGVVPRA